MVSGKCCTWRYLLAIIYSIVLFLRVDADDLVKITYLQSAVAKGAVCLDGSPPAYYLSVGFGSGVNNWLIDIEGGGWCNNVTTCLSRMKTMFGSSKHVPEQTEFSGILSINSSLNPDFYNWNKVKVVYCDGSSFTGDIEIVDSATKLNYRGARIWKVIMDDLLSSGMDEAENALLAGDSAGGLASILHCDDFSDLLPSSTRVKCLSDGGFFVNEKDISGAEWISSYFSDVVATHGSADNLPSSCTSKLTPSLCFFPQNVVQNIKTPVFILNAAYDAWQINNVLVPSSSDPNDTWHDCKKTIKACSSSQLEVIQGFRKGFLHALNQTGNPTSRGLFINSCFTHVQSTSEEMWLSRHSPSLDNTTIANAVGDWYFGRRRFDKIDCPYPCDSTCILRNYTQPTDV